MAKIRKGKWLVWLEYLPAQLLLPGIAALPLPLGIALSRATGRLLYYLLPTYRKVAAINLRLAFGEKIDGARARALAQQAFASFVQTLFEFVALSRLSRRALDRHTERPVGYEEYSEAERRGRGVIMCSIHLANWYWMAVCAAVVGHKISVVIRPLDNPRLDRLMRRSMERHGIRVIPRSRVFPAAVAALRRGETVVLMVDQNAAVGGRFISFFGVPAATMRGVALLRRGTGAAIVCAHEERRGDQHRAVLRELADISDDEETCLLQVNRYFEGVISGNPGEYLWLHPRWKLRPKGESSLYPGLRV